MPVKLVVSGAFEITGILGIIGILFTVSPVLGGLFGCLFLILIGLMIDPPVRRVKKGKIE